MTVCSSDLLSNPTKAGVHTHACCLLPNHYHLLVQVPDLKAVTTTLGRLHGRGS